jgi:hypothetical protein
MTEDQSAISIELRYRVIEKYDWTDKSLPPRVSAYHD